MSVNLSPIFNGAQVFTPAGLPLSGGLISTYLAGSSTPAATYTTSAGNIANSNPIQLGPDGRPPTEIWLTAGIAYKFVLTDSLANLIQTYDNISGISIAPISIWVPTGVTPTFFSATQFTVPGDLSAVFVAGVRIQYTITATQFYGTVTANLFGGGVTTVTVAVDSTPLTSGLNAVNVSQLSPVNSPIPAIIPAFTAFNNGVSVGNTSQTSVSTLDWYLEQTFTPTFSGSVFTAGVTYSTQQGSGTRIGNMFFFQIRIGVTSAGGSSGSAMIGGLPYPPNISTAVSLPAVSDSSISLAADPTAGSSRLALKNGLTGAALPVSVGNNGYTFSISGFYPI